MNRILAIFRQVRERLGISTFCLLALLSWLASCSEDDDDVDEYANWQEVNETYWSNFYGTAKQRVDGGDASWSLLPSFSLVPSATLQPSSYIIVNKLETGSGTESPLFTDTVRIHYVGHLLPSASFPAGYRFDGTYTDAFGEDLSRPATFAVNGLITGWQTALLHMHVGDRWRVYVPYQLGYGVKGSDDGTIPGYSTLVFDMSLVSFWHAGDKVPPLRAPRRP